MELVAGGFEPGGQNDFGKRLVAALPQPADATESGAVGQAGPIEKPIEPIGRDLDCGAHHLCG